MQRRDFLTGAAAAALSASIAQAAAPLADIPIIDTHVHLFDSRRPQGLDLLATPAEDEGVPPFQTDDHLVLPALLDEDLVDPLLVDRLARRFAHVETNRPYRGEL